MAGVTVADDGIAGLTLALRLRLRRVPVTLVPAPPRVPDQPFTLPAPYRDLFLKTGAPLEEAVGLEPAPGRCLVVGGTSLQMPSAGQQANVIRQCWGDRAADEWAALLRLAAARWSALRVGAGGSERSLASLGRRHLRDRRLRLLLASFAEAHGLEPARVGDAAVVLPYLEQVFGRWQFPGGMASLEAELRRRCRELGVEESASDGGGAPALTVEGFWQDAFTAPRRWARGSRATVSTVALGLPWVGMAAEMQAQAMPRER